MKTVRLVLVSVLLVFGVSCSKIVKDTIEKNPDVIYSAMKKDPVKFMTTLRETAQKAQEIEMGDARIAEDKAMEEEFKNPKKFALESDRPILGSKEAPIVIVEYSDLQCPFCTKGSDTMDQVMAQYGDKVSLVFKHLPLESKHPNARAGAEYFEAIAMIDNAKAFKFKKLVFKNQQATYGSSADVDKLFQKLTKEAGVDLAKVKANLKNKKDFITKRINGDMEEARKNGIEGTPGYLVGGVSVKGAYPFGHFKKIIDKWLKMKGK